MLAILTFQPFAVCVIAGHNPDIGAVVGGGFGNLVARSKLILRTVAEIAQNPEPDEFGAARFGGRAEILLRVGLQTPH